MPSFSDSIFLFVLALLLFGPKRLPVLARELGKWVGEFRRASNEFKMQMEEELRISEQSDRQKKIAAMEAAAPVAPPIAEPEHPHLPALADGGAGDAVAETTVTETAAVEAVRAGDGDGVVEAERVPLPIATSGEMRIMPPATGLPVPQQQSSGPRDSALKGLLHSIPAAEMGTEDPAGNGVGSAAGSEPATETTAHGH